MNTSSHQSTPTVADVVGALGEATSALGSLVSHLLEEDPTLALVTALGTGFIAGGGLTSPLAANVMSRVLRATAANLGTFAALDLLRRALEGDGGSPESTRAQ